MKYYLSSRVHHSQHMIDLSKEIDKKTSYEGWECTSTWMHQNFAILDFSSLWSKIQLEISSSDVLVMYLKLDLDTAGMEEKSGPRGIIAEAGMALAMNKPVIILLDSKKLDKTGWEELKVLNVKPPRNNVAEQLHKKLGSWITHPNVILTTSFNAMLTTLNDLFRSHFKRSNPMSWMQWGLNLAQYHALTRSKDPSTKCGAIILDKSHRVVGTGYNGFPPGLNDSTSLLSNREEKYKRVIHAEVNALHSALQRGPLVEATLYSTLSVCSQCAAQIALHDFKAVVCSEHPNPESHARWKNEHEPVTKEIFEARNIQYISRSIYPAVEFFRSRRIHRYHAAFRDGIAVNLSCQMWTDGDFMYDLKDGTNLTIR